MKDILKDTKLSWRSKGLYAVIVEKIAEGTVDQRDLTKMSTDGETAVAKGIKELVDGGYLTRERLRVNGKFEGSRWTLIKEENR